ncbi:MAG: metal-dependent hydrolase [Candidatus Accumulibacter sp.]|jgi:inner membrane protein|nr:metal-dependent hydrolase [Accumulibacter sp.]
MPTILSHPAPILALGAGLGAKRIPPRLLFVGLFFAIAPDFDVIGFRLGVQYADLLGHRGFSHSLFFALCCGVFGFLVAPWLRCRRITAFLVLFTAVASHIALDAATSGGLGVAAFWPVSDARYFFPWRPIRVSPFSIRAFFGARGIAILKSELLWIWLPSAGFALILRVFRFFRRRKDTPRMIQESGDRGQETENSCGLRPEKNL